MLMINIIVVKNKKNNITAPSLILQGQFHENNKSILMKRGIAAHVQYVEVYVFINT